MRLTEAVTESRISGRIDSVITGLCLSWLEKCNSLARYKKKNRGSQFPCCQ